MDWGIPRKLIVDGAIEQVGQNTEFIKRCRTYDINLHVSSPRRPKENPAERVIREIRKKSPIYQSCQVNQFVLHC